jgi:hypothetical protein
LLLLERRDASVLIGDGFLHRLHHLFQFRNFAALSASKRCGCEDENGGNDDVEFHAVGSAVGAA